MFISLIDVPFPPHVHFFSYHACATSNAPHHAGSHLSIVLGQQIPQRQVIHHVLDVLDAVLEAVAPAAQDVVLEVEDLEAGEDVLDELVDEQWALVVAERDGVAREAGLMLLSQSLCVRKVVDTV